MSLRLTLDDHAGGAPGSWLLDTDEATTVGEVADALGVPAESLDAAPPEAPLAESELRSGVSVPPRPTADLAPGTLRLELVGGPFSGEVLPIARGVAVGIGSGASASLSIADPALAPVHATVTVADAAADGRPAPLTATIVPQEGGEVWVNGELVTGSATIVPADLVQLGSSVIRLGIAPMADADLTPDALGDRGFNRPSRIRPAAEQPVVALPGDKPQDPDESPMPWLSAIIPVVLGVTMAVVFGRAIMLLMAAASPIMVIGSFLTNRRLAKKKGVKTEQEWIDDVHAAGRRIAELAKLQRLETWFRLPDPVVIADIATRPLSRLWERRRTDADAMTVRVGVAEVSLDVRFEGGGKDRTSARRVGVSPVPVAPDLRAGALGIAGPADAARSVARSLVAGFATLRSPRDAELVVICPDDAEADWGWTAWLPHAQAIAGTPATIGNSDDTRRERLRELGVMLEHRMRVAGHRGAEPPSDILVVVDGAREYRMLPGMVPLLEHGAAHGIHLVALDRDRSRLPEEAKSVVVIDPADPAVARVETGTDYYPVVLLDGMSVPRCEEIARSLCSIRHVSGVGDDAMLPTAVRYADLMKLDLDDPEPIVRRWSTHPRNTFVIVGATGEGEFAIDISRDGPHALVAGTTGSGKSEFLQALVISLAMANRPDALNFVLVDYKGGSAFADCERLPHTVGMVTNLDARETERALASLDAELKRRERVLRDMNAKDVDSAWAKDADTAARRGLARLMIVIDEFAELRTELPEFIDGLVRIARVGRSLGVNLVLATQRPAGVVTPEMQSNINLRVALRVTDRSDSSDILGSGEAALISPSTPGRGYVRTGPSAAPVAFQTARVAGVRPGIQRAVRVLPRKAELTWEGLGYPVQYPKVASSSSQHTDHDDTDLRALVNLITAATQQLGIQKNPSPWLLPLPTVLPLERFQDQQVPDQAIVLGLEDVPGEQSQRSLTWDVRSGSHLLFIGGSMSGRTTALRTTLAQLVQVYSPADLHLYVLDFGNGALLPLVDAPHTGAVVTQLDADRLPRLVQRLLEELGRRQAVLSAAGVGHISEQRAQVAEADRLPYAVVTVDGWERMLSTMNADQLVTFRDQFMRVLREGPAVGVRVLLTGDRGISGDKITSFMDEQYVLPLRDLSDYRTAGILAKDVPTDLPPGRVLFGAAGTEAQLAVLVRDTSGEAQTAALRRIVEQVRDHFDQFAQLDELPRPFRVDPLPGHFALTASYELPLGEAGAPEGPVVAVGGDLLSRFTIDWPADGGFVVTGGRKSGRSSALAAIVHQLAWRKTPLVVVSPRESILTEVAAGHGIPVITAGDIAPPDLEQVLDGAGEFVTVVVDDAEVFKNAPIEHALTGVKHRAAFIVSADSESLSTLFGGPVVEAKRARRALVLRPESSIMGTQAVGTPIPKFLLGRGTPGSAVLTTSSGWLPVRVPDIRQ
ncbi:FtsK/SpoIIIE domain-containing protein [Agromyces aerolatus]|uniref:FtsK/SpoIIIE domain-containing protein n=1 Tax=Agromyces sp. LY-1074 TaxID=3074080 RepID=UPI002855B6DC|nr:MULTISPECIES: FtsK/SpoIIIE domain-containing protein [unclassified Agromyces]MDR5698427.1 FtsK/SpoIIIE domain-containing protein [Agromyces sp. LY-1074]MDR5704721.1 FtsK/SpoIIIE domain-containing protein [Agromyces sp. LY-1358]